VTVSFSCSDALSGLAPGSPPASAVLGEEGAGQSVTRTCLDKADNSASASVSGLNIDKTPPIIDAHQSPPANENGWNRTDVTVSFTCADALSGLAAGSPPAPVVLAVEGAGQSASGTCVDRAGNSKVGELAGIDIDKTPPSAVTATPDRAADHDGWYNHALTVTWTGADALSGIAACAPPSAYAGPDTATASVTGSCRDRAGNTTSADFGFRFDATAPASEIAVPPEGAIYLLGAAVPSAYGCTDNLSGVAACEGPVPPSANIDTLSVGAKTFTVEARDGAGNIFRRSHSYSVQYEFTGFMPPLHNPPVVNIANGGRTFPLKWQLRDSSGRPISDLGSFGSLVFFPTPCDAAPTAIVEETAANTGGTALRYDAGANQFIFNWQTVKGWVGCRVLQLTLADGTKHLANFEFR
jgi:hypothetical protein